MSETKMRASGGRSRPASSRGHRSSKRAARAKLVRRRLKELGIVLSGSSGRTSDLYNAWIAKAYADVDLPKPWSEYSDDKGRVFYYNHNSGVSKWEHPLLNTFKGLLERSRLEPDLARTGYFRDLYYKLRKYCVQPTSASKGKADGDQGGKEKEGEGEDAPQTDESYKGWWALNLLAATSSKRETGPPPSPEEVKEMCVYLGIDISLESGESGLAWIAKQAVQASLPPDWYEAEDEEGNNFYFNAKSGESSSSHPLDEYFLALVKSERRTKQKLEHRRQTILEYTSASNAGQDDRYAGRLSIALFESHWESIRADWVPFIARRQDTFWYNFRTDERIHLPFWEPRYRIAGRKIAEGWRRYQRRREEMERAAVVIQSNFRRFAVQSAILLWQESCAAVCIQCHVRMHLARVECNRIRAAVRIQRAVREYLFSILQSKHVAATVIQSHVRRALAGRRRAELLRLKKKKEARLRIQANMRRIAEQRVREERAKQEAGRAIWSAYQSHRLRKEMKRRVARRALLRQKQEEYLRKYRSQVMHKKATRIQSAARAFLARRLVGSWNEAAAVIQGAFRRHLAERRERVRALIHLYYDAHATRIQQRWRLFSRRRAAAEERVAAVAIQRAFRRFAESRRRRRRVLAAVRIQANFRRWSRRRAYKEAKAKAERRAYVLRRMQPHCVALGVTVDSVLGGSEDKGSVDEKARALSKLVEKRKNLHARAVGEIARICSSIDAEDLAGSELSIAEKGSPGWLSDGAMAVLKSSLRSLTCLRDRNLDKILVKSESKVVSLCQDLGISERWREKHLRVDRGLGVSTLNYLEILYNRLRSASELAKSLGPLVRQTRLFRQSVDDPSKPVEGFKKKEFPLVLRTMAYLMREIQKHRAKDYEDIALMLDLPKFKEIERMEMLANFHKGARPQASGGEAAHPRRPSAGRRRPTLGGRSTLFAAAAGEEREGRPVAPAPPQAIPGGLKKRPKRKKRASVVR